MADVDRTHHYAAIVAGGAGTRLWPLSRNELPKQLHSLVSDKTLIEDTYERLRSVYEPDHILVSTTANYAAKIQEVLPEIPSKNFVVEPDSRGPGLAFAYLAETLRRRDPQAIVFTMASDHAVTEVEKFHAALDTATNYVFAHEQSIALVGVVPTRPEAGLGYIKVDTVVQQTPEVYSVEKYVEKPSLAVATKYVESGDYLWNVAYYCFKAATLTAAYDDASPESMHWVRSYCDSDNPEDFRRAPQLVHEIEVINASKFPVVVVPATFKWSDIGNWSTLQDLVVANAGVQSDASDHHIDIDSINCYVSSNNEDKLIATVGLKDVIIVDTDDSLLVIHKDNNQDVKSVIEQIKQRGLEKYL